MNPKYLKSWSAWWSRMCTPWVNVMPEQLRELWQARHSRCQRDVRDDRSDREGTREEGQFIVVVVIAATAR